MLLRFGLVGGELLVCFVQGTDELLVRHGHAKDE